MYASEIHSHHKLYKFQDFFETVTWSGRSGAGNIKIIGVSLVIILLTSSVLQITLYDKMQVLAQPDANTDHVLKTLIPKFLSQNLTLENKNTTRRLVDYIVLQTTRDDYAEKVLGIKDQFLTTLAFSDRFGLPSGNNNPNIFLQISHTEDRINSMRGIKTSNDIILANQALLPGSENLQLPKEIGTASSRKTLNPTLLKPEIPKPVEDLLNNIDLINTSTNTKLTHYVLVQSVQDVYGDALGPDRRYVTTVAFQDRLGRDDSNGNLNTFLQVIHTSDDIISLTGGAAWRR